MDQIADIVARAKSAAVQSGLSVSTVSRKLFNDGKAITRLENGGQCTLKTLETARERLQSLETSYSGKRKATPHESTGKPLILSPGALTHLDRLEAEAIHIMREVHPRLKTR